MHDVNRLNILNKLKNVYRFATVSNRKESSAEHSWASLLIADYFLSIMEDNPKIDRLHVYELLMYHDIPEIYAGNAVLHPNAASDNAPERKREAVEQLKKELPSVIGNKLSKLALEFNAQQSIESRFAKAVEQLEAEIHELDYPQDWTGWTEEFLRKTKEHYFKEFPKVHEMFEEIVRQDKQNGYI